MHVAPVRPAEGVIPARQAEALAGDGTARGASATLTVGDDRLAQSDAHLFEPGPQGRGVEEPAVLVDELGPLEVAGGRDVPASPGHLRLAGVFAPAAGVDNA